MKTIELKTNINCSGCIAKVTPVLNKEIGEHNWKVDITSPNKILIVNTNELSAKDIMQAVEKAGYKAQTIYN